MKKPLDWTCYSDRPNAGANPYGAGLLAGYEPVSVFNPSKPQYPISTLTKGPLGVEAESGVWRELDIRKCNPADPKAPTPQAVVMNILALAGVATEARRQAGPDREMVYYCPPLERNNFVWPRPRALEAHERSVQLQVALGALDAFDGVVVDGHCLTEIPYDAWCMQLDTTVGMVNRVTGKPVVVVIEDQWHPSAADPAKRQAYIPESEIVRRFQFARGLRVQRIAHMGGYRGGLVQDGVGVPFRRMPMASNPALPAIMRVLTATT